MALIYLIYDYEEHGPQVFGMTIDPSKLPEMLVRLWPDWSRSKESKVWLEKAQAKMAEFLADPKIGSTALEEGYGGIVLVAREDGAADGA